MSRLLFISFIDFGEMRSGSSVRPQRMYDAFVSLDYQVTLLSGLQNRRFERLRNVFRVYRSIRRTPPDFCYVEPPSGPFFNLCDHLLLLWLKAKKVPIGLFYRDAYWKFADWWQVHGVKRFLLTQMQKFDLFIFHKTCKVLFFPTQSMADLFEFDCKSILPPAGVDAVAPEHGIYRQAVYVGGVSRFYGTDLLLKAFEILNEQMGRKISLCLVCRESEMGRFFEGYREKPWLLIRHASGDRQLDPIYAKSDLAIYPSKRDFYMDFCMPVKLFEYLSRALPIVSTDCREAAGFIEKNGIGLVAKDTPESLAEKIAFLYDNPQKLKQIRQRSIEVLRRENLWIHRARKAAREILT